VKMHNSPGLWTLAGLWTAARTGYGGKRGGSSVRVGPTAPWKAAPEHGLNGERGMMGAPFHSDAQPLLVPRSFLFGFAEPERRERGSARTGDAAVDEDSAAVGSLGSKCTLETVQGTMISFRCPLATGFSDGVEVVLDSK
jgi:hypothetical protein